MEVIELQLKHQGFALNSTFRPLFTDTSKDSAAKLFRQLEDEDKHNADLMVPRCQYLL